MAKLGQLNTGAKEIWYELASWRSCFGKLAVNERN